MLAHTVVFMWVYSLLLRVIGVGNAAFALLGGIVLVTATVGVAVFVLRAAITEVRAANRSEARDEEHTDSLTEADDASEELQLDRPEVRRGGNSPQDTALELTVNTVGEAQGATAPSKMTSPWQLFNLCATESELRDHLAEA